MDTDFLQEMTAPCGLPCFICPNFLANDDPELKKQIQDKAASAGFPLTDEEAVCKGCRRENGLIPVRRTHGLGLCKVYTCTHAKGIPSCAECEDFPCENLHPMAELAAVLPHNTKLYNLALIRKMGLERWAREKAATVRETYFTRKPEL